MAEEKTNQETTKEKETVDINSLEGLMEALKKEGVVLTTKDALEAKTSEACNSCFAWGVAAGALTVAATVFIYKKLNEEE